MEDIQEFCKRTNSTKQRTSLWIQRGELIANKIGGVWVLLGLQAKPLPKGRGKGKKAPLGGLKRMGIVEQYDLDAVLIATHKTIKIASIKLNCHESTIGAAINTESWTAKGYLWKRQSLEINEDK